MENDLEQLSGDEESINVEMTDIVESQETAGTVDPVEEKVISTEEHTGQAKFEGNAHDLTALIALICGAIVLLICVSCGLGIYLLPVVAIVLGVIGVMMAKNAVNPQRSQLWSWLGIGSGVVAVLLALFAFAVYIILIFGFVKGSGY